MQNAQSEKFASLLSNSSQEDSFVLPASFAQIRLWFLDKLEPGQSAYNVPLAVRILGKLNANILELSFVELIARHEILRTTFAEDKSGKPVQVVACKQNFGLTRIDLRSSDGDTRERELRQNVIEEARLAFDLSHGPLFRASLFRMADDDHIVSLTLHHSIVDRWSWRILLKELFGIYEAFLENKPSPLPNLPVQYGDYAAWQQAYLEDEQLKPLLEYWIKQLQGAPPVLDLPTDFPRPMRQSFVGAYESITIPQEVERTLRRLGQQQGATLFMTLLTAFNILLARYSQRDDILIATPMSGRTRKELEGLIGLFVNTLVLRTDVSGNPTFQELLARVRETALQAYTHQDLPFEKLVEVLKPDRNLGHNPVVQVMFSLENDRAEFPEVAGLTITPYRAAEGMTAKFELILNAFLKPAGLSLALTYNVDLYRASTVRRMLSHFTTLLASITADPDCRLNDLPLLTDSEQDQLMVEWNTTRAEYGDRCIHQLFESQVGLTPHAIAVSFEGQEITFQELNSRANQLARFLHKLSVEAEGLVGIRMERSLETIIAMLAVLKAGAIYVPLDPTYPKERLQFIVDDAELSLILTSAKSDGEMSTDARVVTLAERWAEIRAESTNNLDTSASLDQAAYILYTSGSTGQPKGVMGTHRGAVNRMNWMWRSYPFVRGEICCQKTSLNFVDSVWEIFGPLLKGIRIVVLPDQIVRDPFALVAALATQCVTRIVLVPSLLHAVLESCPDIQRSLPRLNYWITSGEALTLELARKFAVTLPGRILLNLYGSTEVAGDSTCYEVRNVDSLARVPIGRPIDNTQLYILDRNMQPVPIGVQGELYVGGDGLALGYLKRPELTAEKFVPNAFDPQSSTHLFRTGDLARYIEDGNVEYLGRSDHQVKIRGVRVELGEIEAVLAKHPSVNECMVIARPDQRGDQQLVAYFVAKREHSGNELVPNITSDWRQWVSRHLPSYMVPAALIVLEAFPLTPNGKIDRRALPALATLSGQRDVIPARSHLEAALSKIWQQLLAVDSISVTDDFFQIGGHSLLAVRLVNEIYKATGKRVPLATLFQNSTIESLARAVNDESIAAKAIVTEVHGKGTKAPFFAIVVPGMNPLGYAALARHLGQNHSVYTIQQPGQRVTDRPYSSLEFENMAKDYVTAMKTVQATGPYHFGGMCEGARIAFEMARLLEGEGEAVGLLTVFDTWVLENSQIRALWKIHYYTGRLRKFWQLPRAEKNETLRKAFQDRLTAFLWSDINKRNTSRKPWPATYWPGRSFVPKKFDGKITVIKRRKQPYFYVRDAFLGWGTRTSANVELHIIDPFPKFHGLIFREPYVRQVSEYLLACMERARDEPSLPARRAEETLVVPLMVEPEHKQASPATLSINESHCDGVKFQSAR
jgi:amino acid adenylation domain-containing protein